MVGPGKRAAAIFALLSAAAAVGALAACDEAPPTSTVQADVLRLIPQVDSVPAAGGEVFVLVELTRDHDARAEQSVVYVRSDDASLAALPGPTSCPADVPPNGGEAAVPDASASTNSARLTIPATALLADSVRDGVVETGFVVRIPTGTGPIVITATAFEHTDSPGSCAPSSQQLLALATVTINRAATSTDAATEAAPPDASSEGGADAATDSTTLDGNLPKDATTDGVGSESD